MPTNPELGPFKGLALMQFAASDLVGGGTATARVNAHVLPLYKDGCR
jgi:hypothetical protein